MNSGNAILTGPRLSLIYVCRKLTEFLRRKSVPLTIQPRCKWKKQILSLTITRIVSLATLQIHLMRRTKNTRARNNLTSGMCALEHEKWKKLVTDESPKTLWEKIDWKGNLSKSETLRPTNDELALHFEKLYSCDDKEELDKSKSIYN